MKINFLDNIQQPSSRSGLSNLCESYLYLDGISNKFGYRKITLPLNNSSKIISFEESNLKKFVVVALKIISYATVLLPLLAICGKIVFRSSLSFKQNIQDLEKAKAAKNQNETSESTQDPYELHSEADLAAIPKDKINSMKVGLDPVYGQEIYNPKGVGLTYQMDYLFHNICQKHGVKHWLICGSTLGQERNNGRIAWDDDDDIGVFQDDVATMTSGAFKADLASVGLAISKIFFGFKIYATNDEIEYSKLLGSPGTADEEPYKWPFLDIFVFQKSGQDRYEYVGDRARGYWPNEYLLHEELFDSEGNIPLKKYGPIVMPVPNKSIDYLKRSYGANCMTHGRMGWDVEHGCPHVNKVVELTDFAPAKYLFDPRYPRPQKIDG